jgi:hypothetical protein
MSTFGYDIFENDEAIAWMEELLDSPGIDLLGGTLHAAIDHDKDALGRSQAERALAAAETIAVWHGHAGDGTPLEIIDWVAHQETPLPPDLLQLARSAVERVTVASELAREWEREGELEEWKIVADDLTERLHR